MKTQTDRIKALLDDRQVPERKRKRLLSDVSGASYEAVRQWFEKDLDNIRSEWLTAISKHFKANLTWLVSGEGFMDGGDRYSNGREVETAARKIPVLSYVEAGKPKQVIDDYHAGAGMSEITIDTELEQELSMESFALVVSGNSMAPDYKDGDIVVVDPSVKPWPGDIVVAVLSTDNEATIKKYRSRGNDETGHHVFELVPINEDYHTITVSSKNPGHIIGTVVEHRRNLRRRR